MENNHEANKHLTYEDFNKYLEEHKNVKIVEMNTVEGKKGGKVFKAAEKVAQKIVNWKIIFLIHQDKKMK